ncbi:MAG: hypothetical protein Q4G05_06630 [Clostridia bacterium]|nr:hypothetical protein [Clostridia bacterium]
MNQILSVNKNNKGKQKVEITKIVKIFAIVLIVFATIMIAIVATSIYKKQKEERDNSKIPQVNMEQENNKIKISITHDKVIDRILYNWNNGEENTLYGMGKNSLEEYVDLIEGTNTLNIKVIDSEGQETSYNKEFIAEGIDLQGPEIEMILEGTELKIVANDDEGISNLKYSINEAQSIEVPITGEDKTKMETRISVTKGENTVSIIATDINQNTTVKEQTFKGATKPKIELFKDGGNLLVVITDEEGIKDLECVLNEQVYTKEINDKKVEFTCPLKSGINVVKIKVTNINGLVADADGTCEYNP